MESETLHDEYVRAVLEGFDGVWRRVEGSETNTSPQPRHDPSLCLEQLAGDELRAAAYDRALAGCLGPGKQLLLRHASQAVRRAQRLRAEIFLRTGARISTSESCPRTQGIMDSLREAMLRDEAAAAAYDAAAVADGDLSPLLRDYACQRRAASQEKRELILRCFR